MVKFDAKFRSTSDRFSAGFRNTDERFGADFGSVQMGGGGSEVIIDPVLTEGTKIATITVDDEPADLYAPTPVEPPVTSVNGKTGDVELDADDVGALPDDTPIPEKTSDLLNDSGFINAGQAPVQSVNGQTGNVTVDVPTKTSELVNDSGYITSAPVASVNGQTGAVVLDADDVGALPDDTVIPTDTADLTNGAGFLTLADLPIYQGGVG